MPTTHREPVVCECGHTGTVVWQENESPFSREWQTYKINGFEGESLFIRDAITLDDALVRMNPKCPECDVVNKISYIRSA